MPETFGFPHEVMFDWEGVEGELSQILRRFAPQNDMIGN
jgi:hypothetical protein